MKPGESADRFKKFALANGVDLLNCTPRQGVDQMLAFFRQVKPVGCEDDGDMLLFQYGIDRWSSGRLFKIDITRQFSDLEHVYEDEDEDEDDQADDHHVQAALSQLHLTFRFDPTPELAAIEADNRWYDRPASEQRFLSFIDESTAMRLLGNSTALSVELDHGMV